MKIDLITGFLGSGKTTFLKLYAKYLLDSGLTLGILENDFGAVNVDMMLLNELEGDNCELEMVSGACHADCHARRFKTKLIALGMSGYDRVIVEPSGIFDVDEFFDALREEPLNRMYEVGNVIAIVDSNLSDDMSDESNYYLASQVANSGAVLLSKSQLSDASCIDATINHIKKAVTDAKCNRSTESINAIINTKNWFDFDSSDWNNILNCGHTISSYTKSFSIDNASFSSVYFLELQFTTQTIKEKIRSLMTESIFGNIFRIKGFYRENNCWHQVNATHDMLTISDIKEGQEVIIVIGENLNRDAIEKFMSS